jgi:Ni,Fe-hydrogenase III large subunit
MLQPVNAKVMENIYEMFCGSRVLYGVEVWGVKREWEIGDKIRGRSLKEFIRSHRNTANRAAEWEFGRILTQARCLVV